MRPRLGSGLAVLGCVLLAGAAIAEPLTFAQDHYSSFAGARAIVTADFDRDGWPDIAHANAGRNTVTVLLNRRGTEFQWFADTRVGTGPFDLTTADFNRDGIPDLAVANADSNSISILLGLGDGRFARDDLATGPLLNPRGIAAADWNNDGRPDLIVTGYASRAVQVLVGSGDGGFVRGPTYVGTAAQPQGVATADFNQDGRLDVAVAYVSAAGLRILYGADGPSLAARSLPGAANLNVVATGDLNADGWIDVAAASTSGNNVAIYLGRPAGLVHARSYPTGPSPRGISIADVDRDGVLDVITANRASSTISVLRGDGTRPGTLLPAFDVAAGLGSRDVVVEDFDADGRLDLATANEYAAAVTVLSNTTPAAGAANVFSRLTFGTSSGVVGGANDVWPADFDHDGKLDVATLADEDPWRISVLLASGTTVTLPGSGYPDGFAVADFNADGNPDILFKGCCSNGSIDVYLGDGRGGFTAAPRSSSSSLLFTFAIGDMNGDSRPDLLFVGANAWTSAPGIVAMIGRGDGTFRDGVLVPLDRSGRGIRVVDFNRDGRLDLGVLLIDGTLQVWFGNGAGGISASPASVTFTASEGADDLKFGDLDRDGYQDAVVVHGGGVSGDLGRLGVAPGRGTGFGEPAYYEISDWGMLTNVVVLGDLNVDGVLDIVSAGGDFLPGQGDGTFGPNEPFDYRAVGIRIVDFTRDGLPDILFGTSQGEVAVLVNERNDANRRPEVSAGPDVTIPYEHQIYGETAPWPLIEALGSDPDLHRLNFEWRDAAGRVVSTERALFLWGKLPGLYAFTLKVDDGRGASVTDSVVVTVAPTKEIVLHVGDDTISFGGNWSQIVDTTAAAWVAAHDPNLRAAKVAAPLAAPPGYVRLPFIADPTQTYKLWLRLKADGNSWANDSVWVQFSGSTDVSGNPKYRVGTTSGLAVSLEECVNCGVSGWGWADDGWGAPDTNGVLLRFPGGGVQEILIQTREDGVSLDHVVLSSEKFLTVRPGAARNDNTILQQTYTPF